MTLTILVPLDGSPLADRALPVAAGLASGSLSGRSGHLVLVHVQPPTAPPDGNGYDPSVAVETLRARGVSASSCVCRASAGDVPSVLLRAAREEGADTIVMSTHGRGGFSRWIIGSVADQVMRRADVPVMLVPPHHEPAWAVDRQPQILVSLDGSRLAEEAIEPSARLAAHLGAELLLVRALSPTLHTRYRGGKVVLSSGDFTELDDAWHYLTGVADGLRASGHRASVWVVVGTPAAAIVEAARAEKIDLIAMTTHGRGGIGRLLVGSIADGVLRRSHVPILLVRSGMAGPQPVGASGADAGSAELAVPVG